MTHGFTSLLTLVFASTTVLLAAPASAAPGAAKAEGSTKAAAKPAPAAEKPEAAATKSDAPTADPEAPGAPPPEADETAEPSAKPTAEDKALVADAEAGSSPVELPGQTYYAVGLRYRAVIVPKFMMNLFGDGGRTVLAHGIGPEFTIRKNAFEYNLSAWFASYAMDPTPFKAKSDGAEAWEVVESKIKILYLTADFMWSQDLAPEFAFNYGVGAGFGLVWGDLKRTQAYPGAGANNSTGEGFLPCQAVNNPNGNFCGNDNNHYNGYKEPSWANGGSKPVIFPWLALQTGLRYKPHRNFIARLDAGFGTSGFFVGLGADYGL